MTTEKIQTLQQTIKLVQELMNAPVGRLTGTTLAQLALTKVRLLKMAEK